MKLQDKAPVVRGDILDLYYWQAKYAARRLDAAVETRQPDSIMLDVIPPVINACAEVLKEHPHHEDVRSWQKRALLLRQRIKPYAMPGVTDPSFAHWIDPHYEAGWSSYHLANMSLEAEFWGWARSFAADALNRLGFLSGRMSGWAPDVQHWIRAATQEMIAVKDEADRIVKDHSREHDELREIVSGNI